MAFCTLRQESNRLSEGAWTAAFIGVAVGSISETGRADFKTCILDGWSRLAERAGTVHQFIREIRFRFGTNGCGPACVLNFGLVATYIGEGKPIDMSAITEALRKVKTPERPPGKGRAGAGAAGTSFDYLEPLLYKMFEEAFPLDAYPHLKIRVISRALDHLKWKYPGSYPDTYGATFKEDGFTESDLLSSHSDKQGKAFDIISSTGAMKVGRDNTAWTGGHYMLVLGRDGSSKNLAVVDPNIGSASLISILPGRWRGQKTLLVQSDA